MTATAALTLWGFLGLECATILADEPFQFPKEIYPYLGVSRWSHWGNDHVRSKELPLHDTILNFQDRIFAQLLSPITLERTGDRWRVEYDYTLPPVRAMFFESKVERVLLPALRDLRAAGWDPSQLFFIIGAVLLLVAALAAEELPDLLKRLAAKPPELKEEVIAKVTYWDTWPYFLLFVSLLGTEWFLRKRWGMV